MKKPQMHTLAAVTLIFAAFTLGFFLGRNYNHTNVQVSVPKISAPTTSTEDTAGEEVIASETEVQISFPIDINTAPKESFMQLPGIGEVIAQRIIDYREKNGNFTTVEELLNVEGIGTKRLEAILDFITAGG